MTTEKETLLDIIEGEITTDELIELVSTINNWNGSLQYFQVYEMDYLDELFNHLTPTDLISLLNSDFSLTDDFFRENSLGLIESLSKVEVENFISANYDEIMENFLECAYSITRVLYFSKNLTNLLEKLVELKEVYNNG